MNQQRGPYKSRDPEITKQLLVDTVGEVLRTSGFHALGVNRIGSVAGVHKKLIYWYFNSLNNLIRTYIKRIDFWTPIFEKFRPEAPPQGDALRDFIVGIFLEQFELFHGNTEMQRVILWQVTEANQMLKEVSDAREAKAAPIVDLTDPHFSGSGISFRAVLALVLGGIYYVVWHAKANKSKVCGLDINNERDKLAFEAAIGQVIQAVWKMAEQERGSGSGSGSGSAAAATE